MVNVPIAAPIPSTVGRSRDVSAFTPAAQPDSERRATTATAAAPARRRERRERLGRVNGPLTTSASRTATSGTEASGPAALTGRDPSRQAGGDRRRYRKPSRPEGRRPGP